MQMQDCVDLIDPYSHHRTMPNWSIFCSTAATGEIWLSHLPQIKKYGSFRTPYSKQYDELEYEICAYDMMMLEIYQSSTGAFKANLCFLLRQSMRWKNYLEILRAASINVSNGPPVLDMLNIRELPAKPFLQCVARLAIIQPNLPNVRKQFSTQF